MGTWAGRRVLVTGGTGFVGQHLSRRLVQLGARLTLALRPDEAPALVEALPAEVERRPADVRDEDALGALCRAARPEFVFHLAAVGVIEPFIAAETALAVNVQGTLHLLRAATETGVGRLVVTGTSYEYGQQRLAGQLDPGNVYAASKVAAWAFCRMFYRAYGAPVVVVRPFNIYGPGQSQRALIPAAIRAAHSHTDFETTPGEQRRDFIYVDDVIEGLIAAAVAPEVEGESLDLGTGLATPVRQVVERIFALTGSAGRPRIGALPYRPGLVWELVANAERTARLTGWRAKVGLDEGLRATIQNENV